MLQVSEDRRTGPEKLQRAQIVGIPDRIRLNQLHAESDPLPHVTQRQDRRNSGKLPDVLQPHHHIDLRQLHPDFKPRLQLLGRNDVKKKRRRPEIFQSHIGILFGQFGSNGKNRATRFRLVHHSQHARAFFEILQGRRTGRFHQDNPEIEPGNDRP